MKYITFVKSDEEASTVTPKHSSIIKVEKLSASVPFEICL